MTSPIQLVEAALLERLRGASRPYAGLTVESYGAQLDDETFAWLRTVPACWVTFDQIASVKRISRRRLRVAATFEVLAAQRALVTNQARLGGTVDARDVGIYQLLEDNKLALANQRLGLGIDPITPGAVRAVMKGQVQRDAMAIYAQQFATSWVEEIPDDELASDGTLIRVGLHYFIKPGDEVEDTTDELTTTIP